MGMRNPTLGQHMHMRGCHPISALIGARSFPPLPWLPLSILDTATLRTRNLGVTRWAD